MTDIIETHKQLFDVRDKNQALLSEVHHRVKNNLTVFSSLLQLDQWEQEDSEL